MKNLIYRGPVATQSLTISLPVNGGLMPGIFVTTDGKKFNQATGSQGRLLVLNNRQYYDQDLNKAYEDTETGDAYRVLVESEFQCRMGAGSYSYGQELSLNGSGQLESSAIGDIVIAYFDQADSTIAAGALADVVIANRYTKG